MNLNFVGHDIEVTPALKDFATEKFKHLEKRFHPISNITLTFQIENYLQVASATIHLNGTEIHATAKNEDMYHAIDELIAKLNALASKHKDKMTEHRE